MTHNTADIPTVKPSQPDASQAKVYRQLPDGTYEEVVFEKRGMGANIPEDWKGLTPDQLLAKRALDAQKKG